MNLYNRVFTLPILFVLLHLHTSAQVEFLVTVNPNTGTFTKIDSLPGVKWITAGPSYTTFDKNNRRFIFKGADKNWNWYLYSIDAKTGKILFSPPFPILSDSADNIIELQYDNAANTLYGLHWDQSEGQEYFISIDLRTGMFTKINQLFGVKSIPIGSNLTSFDENHHRYIFTSNDANGIQRLYSVDATTGNIISDPVFPVLADSADNVLELQFDNSTNTMYALHWDNSDRQEFLIKIDPISGTLTKVAPLPGVKWVSSIPHYSVFDEVNQRYIFRGGDSSGKWYLYSVDAITGQIMSQPSFPTVTSPDNLIELQCDNSSGILYALHWHGTPSTDYIGKFSINPNPIITAATITLDKTYRDVQTFIYNSLGQLMRKQGNSYQAVVEIQTEGLASGVYYIKVVCNNLDIGTKKVIVE